MFSHSTTKVSSDHVQRIVHSIVKKKQRKVVEQQQTFLRRNTDENQKRNNYLVEKFTKMKTDKDEEEEDFVSTTRRKVMSTADNAPTVAVVVQDENEETLCPICNDNLSKFVLLKDREEHVDRCLNRSSVEKKAPKLVPTTNHKCQICGTSFNAKHLYLAHLKKCSSKNSVQLKHVIQFATKAPTEEPKPTKVATIKNRVIKMEMPRTADDEQQQLAVALSASLKPDDDLPNAFELLQQAATTTRKRKIIDLTKTALWNISPEDKVKISATRLSALCERVIGSTRSDDSYRFPPSVLQSQSENEFGRVEWWNITTTDPQDDEIPMTQLARILNDDDE